MDSLTTERPCPNCGAIGAGTYCSSCGRRLQTRMPTVVELFVELKDEVLGVERRALSTLWSAITRPGEITEAYRRGDGGKFVSPLKLYLTISAIYFTIALATGSNFNRIVVNNKPGTVRMDIVIALSIPIMALTFKLLYGVLGGLKVRVSEAVSLSLALVSTLFTLAIALIWLPSLKYVPVAVFGFGLWYIWKGARTLWSDRGILAPVRAGLVALLYGIIVLLTAAGVFTSGFG